MCYIKELVLLKDVYQIPREIKIHKIKLSINQPPRPKMYSDLILQTYDELLSSSSTPRPPPTSLKHSRSTLREEASPCRKSIRWTIFPTRHVEIPKRTMRKAPNPYRAPRTASVKVR